MCIIPSSRVHYLSHTIMSLHIIAGPMFSGKTTSLMQKYARDVGKNQKPLVLDFETNDVSDDTFVDFRSLKNHDGLMIDNVVFSKRLMSMSVTSLMEKFNTVLVNEAQFFPDLFMFVKYHLSENKNIYLYGLDGDFEQQPMGHILALVPHCDSFTKLNGKCANCGVNPSIFSHRLGDNRDKIIIDHNKYIPVCRTCHDILKANSAAYTVGEQE